MSSVGQTYSASGVASSATCTFTSAVNSGSFLVVFSCEGAIVSISGVSDNVNGAWTHAPGGWPFANGATDEVDCYYFAGSASASANGITVTVTYSVSLGQSLHIAEVRMTTTPGTIDTQASGTGVSTTPDTSSVTPSKADAILLACTESSVGESGTWVAGSSSAWTLFATTQNHGGAEYYVQSAAAARHGDMSFGASSTWADGMLVIISSGGSSLTRAVSFAVTPSFSLARALAFTRGPSWAATPSFSLARLLGATRGLVWSTAFTASLARIVTNVRGLSWSTVPSFAIQALRNGIVVGGGIVNQLRLHPNNRNDQDSGGWMDL